MEPFLGQIQMFGFNFNPRGWSLCDGQVIPIAQYTALFSLLGTTFGGDGRTDFRLPDLRGRSATHVGSGPGLDTILWGQKGGHFEHTLSINHLPSHNHNVNIGGAVGTTAEGSNNYIAFNTSADTVFTPAGPNAQTLNAGTISHSGGGQPINTRNPYLGIYHCISMVGIFPSRN